MMARGDDVGNSNLVYDVVNVANTGRRALGAASTWKERTMTTSDKYRLDGGWLEKGLA